MQSEKQNKIIKWQHLQPEIVSLRDELAVSSAASGSPSTAPASALSSPCKDAAAGVSGLELKDSTGGSTISDTVLAPCSGCE
jgi:hypothetical protein